MDTIKHISNRTSSVCEGVLIHFLKAGRDASIIILLIIFNTICRTKEWSQEWMKSCYLPIYNK